MNNEEQELELTENEEIETESGHSDEESTDYKELYETEKERVSKLKQKLYLKNSLKPESIITKSTDEKWKQKMELKVEGYDDEAVDFLLKNGGRKALENPYIVSAIDAMKIKKANDAAMISSEGQKSSTEKRFSNAEFARLSHEDQLKALSELNR